MIFEVEVEVECEVEFSRSRLNYRESAGNFRPEISGPEILARGGRE
jgi:hypothetical protein